MRSHGQKPIISLSILLISAMAAYSCGRPGDGSDIPQPTYAWLSENVFEPKCLSCHTTESASYGVDLSSYAQIIATGSVVSGDPSKSTLYTQTFAGLMPKSGTKLTDSENQAIHDWIKSGATDETATVTPAAAPTVSSVSPTSGPKNGSTSITISGSGFSTDAAVSLGGSACTSVTLVSSSSLTCITPSHSPGVVDVEVTNSDGQAGTLSGGFTYNDVILATPAITTISPISGTSAGGTALTINGSSFEAGASAQVGGTGCTGLTVVSATQITCTTPAHVAGTVDVVVTNTNGQSGILAATFSYTISATYSSIYQNILQPKCISCHAGSGAPKGVDYSTYAKTMSTGSVVTGSAATSKLHTRTIDGTMPKNDSPLSGTETSTIQTWINNGAQNN